MPDDEEYNKLVEVVTQCTSGKYVYLHNLVNLPYFWFAFYRVDFFSPNLTFAIEYAVDWLSVFLWSCNACRTSFNYFSRFIPEKDPVSDGEEGCERGTRLSLCLLKSKSVVKYPNNYDCAYINDIFPKGLNLNTG